MTALREGDLIDQLVVAGRKAVAAGLVIGSGGRRVRGDLLGELARRAHS